MTAQHKKSLSPSTWHSLHASLVPVLGSLQLQGLVLHHIHRATSPALATSSCSSKVTSATFLVFLEDVARFTLTFNPVLQIRATKDKSSSWAACELLDQR